jgi:hypothetical protein
MKIFKGLLGGKASNDKANSVYQKASMVINFNACPLGLSITKELSKKSKVIAISSNSYDFLQEHKDLQAIPFTGRLSEQEDRNRLVAFLKHESLKLDKVIHNQPFMLAPTP